MHLRILASILTILAVMNISAQNDPVVRTNTLPRPATPATTNLFTTNTVTTTNLFAPTNAITRPLGLMEAIQLALTNNFDIRIERFSPQIAQTDLDAAKGAYDPVLNASADHIQEKTDTRDSKTERLQVGVGAYLPTGGTVDIGVNASETGGTQFSPTNRDAILSNESSFSNRPGGRHRDRGSPTASSQFLDRSDSLLHSNQSQEFKDFRTRIAPAVPRDGQFRGANLL
jgi:hypothetical protein